MSIKYQKISLLVGISFLILLVSFLSIRSIYFEKSIKNKTNNLHPYTLTNVNGIDSVYSSFKGHYTIFFFINTDCEHCQYEARMVKDMEKEFVNSRIFFISSENLKIIKDFSDRYKLSHTQNVVVGQMNPLRIRNDFGVTVSPTIYIYSKEATLFKIYKGETKIEAILKYLK